MRPLSICITSCNRFKYLKSLINSLESLKDSCEFVVADMGSTEPGLRDYLDSLEWIKKYYHDEERDFINDEYKARNKLLEMSSHDTLLFLQDDSQFIATKEVLKDVIDDMYQMEDCYVVEIFGVRKQTLRDTVDMTPTVVNGHKYWRRKDRHYITTGIYKREVYETIGMYPTEWPKIKEYWGKSEDWYDKKFKQNFPQGNVYRTHVPLALSIWNAPGGGYAFIRENKRFGEYKSPVGGELYYEKSVTTLDVDSIAPCSFSDVAKPIGWSLAVDENGEIKKHSQWAIFESGPYEEL